MNIHYFKWLFPFFGMFAWLAIRDFSSLQKLRVYGIAALVLIPLLFLLSIRLIPTTVNSASAVIEDGTHFDVSFDGPVTIQALDFALERAASGRRG
jgi:hypothetical protein